ncbi:class I SAM-dependent methyltransferase [Fulvivirgaceae bacterium BMA10]|uniref:Class I SAM-dependent methyltransferase n=1 Tax=Splendidivirga corallicola TaxID=3051826 RepID=A0ABT8KTD2_9BACT|nr:class I SAM-dependent methyltransferase [Fulvivirgaceae bacterium BMA10]
MSNLYNAKWIGYGYDLLASLVWFPSKSKLYDKCVTLANIKKGSTVLELGCGTGYLTKKLVHNQAEVTSVDQSSGMLTRAKQRVPFGKFVQSDIFQYKDTMQYDYIVLFFVLHELTFSDRTKLLRSAKKLLNKNGEIIICDFSTPDRGIMKTMFPKLVRLWESPETVEVLKNGFFTEIKSNNLEINYQAKLHNGRVQFLKLKTNEL